MLRIVILSELVACVASLRCFVIITCMFALFAHTYHLVDICL